MQIVPTTVIALLAILAIIRLGPCRGLWVFFALTPLGAAAAFNLPAFGGASIVLADAAALTLFGALLLQKGAIGRLLATMRPPSPGFYLIALFSFAVFATLVFPRLFAGTIEVFGIARVEGVVGIVSRPLQPTTGNLTQLFRFSLGVMACLALATVFRRTPDPSMVVKAMAINAGVHVTLGILEVTTFNLGIAHVFDIIRTANYAMATNQVMAGLKRMIGGFPEASAFGYHTMGILGFWLQYWFDRGQFRYASWILLATLAVLILSTSTGAYVAAFLLFCIFVIVNSGRVLSRKVNFRVAAIMGGLVVLIPILLISLVLAYQLMPPVSEYFDRMLFDKLSSDSGMERMSWNIQAFRNFMDTWMIGAGLGSVRASNWLLASLASLGLIGTLLFLAFITSVFRCSVPDQRSETAIVLRALKMGCVGLLARAMITKATPNLELSFFAMAGLIAGLSASAYLARRSGQPERAQNVGPSRSAI